MIDPNHLHPVAPTCTSRTALHLALQQRHVAVANLLLDHGIDVNAVTKKMVTPLMVAASCCTEMVQPLLERGADPLARNMKKQRALDIASEMGYVTAATLLASAVAKAEAAIGASRAAAAVAVSTSNTSSCE